MALHIKYRPDSFDEFVGNKLIVKTFSSLLDEDDCPHSFLFTGYSGCGKTTLARIAAKKLEVSEFDFTEVDSADFRGIDMVREIRKLALLSPVSGKSKAWLLDECHQLSKDAQHALLKLLEDTPSHTYFFLATTDPEKLLLPLKNRCHIISVSPLNDKEIEKLLDRVISKEKIHINDDVLDMIIDECSGIPRTALILLEQLKNIKSVKKAKGIIYKELYTSEVIDICRLIIKKKSWQEVISVLNTMVIFDNSNAESIRLAILGYLTSCIKSAQTPKDVKYYAGMMEIFVDNLTYSSAKNELIYRLSVAYLRNF